MKKTNASTTEKLLDSFMRFKRLHWKKPPVEGLKHSEMVMLFSIHKQSDTQGCGIKMSELSKSLKIALPTATQLVNSLENEGYVERRQDKNDRRAVRITLTDKGNSIIKKASEDLFSSFEGLVDYLGEEKSLELTELMSEVFTYFNEINKHK